MVGVVSMIVRLLDRIGFLLRDRETRPGRLTNAVLYALNTVFIALYVVSTYDLPAPYPTAVRVAELGLGVVFLGEYVARVYSADDPRGEVTDPFTVVDLVAVLPVFALGGANVGFLRGFHTLRVFRFLRLLVDERQVLGRTLHQRTVRRVELSVTIFLIFFITSGFVYAVEVRANPGIENFGEAFYYTVIAVSTVGFEGSDTSKTTSFTLPSSSPMPRMRSSESGWRYDEKPGSFNSPSTVGFSASERSTTWKGSIRRNVTT